MRINYVTKETFALVPGGESDFNASPIFYQPTSLAMLRASERPETALRYHEIVLAADFPIPSSPQSTELSFIDAIDWRIADVDRVFFK